MRLIEIATAANGVAFQLYHAVPPTGQDLYYLFGGWQSGDNHIKFLSTTDPVTLAKSIWRYMTVDVVRHIDGDIGALQSSTRVRPKKLRLGVYKVPASEVVDWQSRWQSSDIGAGDSAEWDLRAEVQKQHKAFRQIGEATNSVSAFGGKDAGWGQNLGWDGKRRGEHYCGRCAKC
ncbi:hypothetical protein CLCR_05178 [Cladophialophora carrionii]|uniref:Uncharacterized protein n=1 Tax=Cladophialophora carrionii TaxID=86049 RepID=A0A1C1CKP6_9EURO|nr:hypothetical protein CLCR_05178 [Cladophialophora carrionii]